MKNFKMLTIEELKVLRSEIVLNSIYTNDYENSLPFDAELLFNFFEGYSEFLYEEMQNNELNFNDSQYNYLLSKYDTIENLYEYYSSLEIETLECLFVKIEQ